MDETRLIPPVAAARARPLGRIPFGFGSRFFVWLLLGLGWLVPAWWFPRLIAAMFLWNGVILAAWLWDLLRLPGPSDIEIRRIWKTRPALACANSVTVEVRNAGRIVIHARVTDETPLALRLEPAVLELRVRPGATQAQYPILPSERGDARLGGTFIRYQSAMQLAERWAVADTAQVVRVLPNIEEAKQHTLYLIRSRQVEMERRRRRQRGLGREFDSLREYRDGDDIRDISWTATARRNRLVTRIFEIERSQIVWLVLDAGRLLRAQVEEPGRALRISKLDYAVNAALSLAQVALHCGDRVGLLAYGRRIQQNVNAGRGQRHVRAIVESLALVRGEVAEADHGRAVHTLLGIQKRRSLVVWITDFAETPAIPEVIEYATHMTLRHLVLFAAMGQPDLTAVARSTPASQEDMYRHVAALEISHRRDVLLRGLRQSGVLAVELMPNVLATSLVNQYLDIKERSLL
ncbi:MAG TPA: DUF58 domain-containing protein [Candidatus Acidoferrales bacterium]|nr:DUF58 domain-containing protein [Candidatus Acidoferrales bacterium]